MASVQDRANYYLVDSRGEGGLVSELDRVAMVDEPTLIIGLGGTGADALLNTKYVLHRKLKYKKGQTKPGRLAYLAIDTDASDLRNKRVGDTRLSPEETCDITEPNLAAFMGNHSLITQAYKRDWLSDGIPPLVAANGASGIRQYGRFMLISKADAVSAKIRDTVSKIWAAGKENGAQFVDPTDKVNVYILAGISGGTGSGTFLDVAYMVKQIITKQMGHDMRIRGVIFLPEVNECKINSEQVRKYLPVNGYAALKELDFWMNPERGRNFKQQYAADLIVDTNETPFELCFMISPNGARTEDYSVCMQTTGEAMLNILSGYEHNAAAVGPQGFESYVSNLKSMLDHISKPYAGNYIFSTMGMDERRLQLDQMATYIAYYLLQQVQKLFDHTPSKDEVNAFYTGKIKLDERNMQRLFHQSMNVQPYPNVRDFDSFKDAIKNYNHTQVLNETQLEQELDMWSKQCAIFYSRNKDAVIEERAEAIGVEIEKLFADQQIGPFYAHRMLHNIEVGAPDVLKKLKESIDKLEAFLLTADNLREQKRTAAAKAKESARKAKFVPLIAGAKYDEYVEAVFAQYDHERYIQFAQVLRNVYLELYEKTVNYNNLIVGKFVSLLNALTEVFSANANIISGVKRDGNTHNWNVFNFDEIKPYIDKAIDEMKHAGKTADLVHEFLEMLLKDRDAWLDDNGDLGASFSRFVSEKFSEIMDMTLETHYMTILGLNTDDQLVSHIENEVLPQLRAGSKVMFHDNTTLCPIGNAAQRSMICYPRVATNIGNAIQNFVNTNTDLDGKALNGQCDVVPNHRRGSIFWFRSTFGMPLYSIRSIANYQAAYDRYGLDDHHLGRHLKMRGDENWLDLLPPLMPDSVWSHMGYNNDAQAKKNEESRAIFAKAWENGIILPMPNANGKFVVGCVDETALQALLATAPLNAEDQKLIAEQGAAAAASIRVNAKEVQAFMTKAEEFAANGWQVSSHMLKSDVFNTLRNGELVEKVVGDKRNRQILSENLTLTPDTVDMLRHQLELKDKLQAVIAVHKTFTELGNQEQEQRSFFAQCLFYGLYRKILPKVYQFDGAEEGMQAFPLMSISDYSLAPTKDNYYAMFRKFNTLTAAQKETMKRVLDMRVNKVNNEMSIGNNDRYKGYITNLQEIDAAVKKRINEIFMDATYDHPEVLEFYQALCAEFEQWLSE